MLETYNPISCRETLSGITTIKDSIRSGTPTTGAMIRAYGKVKVEAYLKIWIINLNETINVKRPLKESQIDECAYLIVNKFISLSVADINIVFRKAKSGEYGDLYETMSIDKIVKWFIDYFDEKCNVAASLSRRRHDNVKYVEEKVNRVSNSVEEDKKLKEVKAEYLINKNKKKDEDKEL